MGHYSKRYCAVSKLKVDLHDCYNDSRSIEESLQRVIRDAVSKRIALVEIIPGKGSGQLKKRVMRFLQQPDIKAQYHRIEKDSKNFGRLFVHFRFD
jgi:DNA-nicking Smr family endonuclease